ncbi:MAG: Hsp20/alpha crystallin family protein [Paludibacteraceae bacterium]|nr:Hsp20/alpha crystallin family protein [Paludibacteraceae bacterium]MBO7635426.1 Hsp20/alpha crystallin family protein [Paludibacteraceae bacterium]
MLDLRNSEMFTRPFWDNVFGVNFGMPMFLYTHPFDMKSGYPVHSNKQIGNAGQCGDSKSKNECDYYYNHQMQLNIAEDDNMYKIMMSVPGMDKENVNVFLDNGILHVKANKKEETEDKTNYITHQIKTDAFEETFEIPENVDKESITAKVEKGILTISMSKKTKQENIKQIEVL